MGCASTKPARTADGRSSTPEGEVGTAGLLTPSAKVAADSPLFPTRKGGHVNNTNVTTSPTARRGRPDRVAEASTSGANQYPNAVLPPTPPRESDDDTSGSRRRVPTSGAAHALNEAPLRNGAAIGYTSVAGAPAPWTGVRLPIDPGLPVGWEKITSPAGDVVYVDHIHGTHAAHLPPGPHTALPADGSWEQRIAAGSRLFFVDHMARRTQWMVPDGYCGAHRVAQMPQEHMRDGKMLGAHVHAHRATALAHETAISTKRHGPPRPPPPTVHGTHDTSLAPDVSELPPRSVGSRGSGAVGMAHVHHGLARFVKEHPAKMVRDFRSEARAEVARILDQIHEQRCTFEDSDFEPPADVPDKVWLRPNKLRYDGHSNFIKKGARFRLFDAPEPADAKQGTIGDCWLISSLGLLCGYQNGRLLKDVFPGQTEYDDKAGAVVVRLCVGGVYHNVVIDDRLPCLTGGAWNDSNRCLSFALSSRLQLWSPFVEKAYAKCCDGYLNLISGSATEALSLLTGSPTVTHNINCPDSQIPAVWASLLRATKLGSLMVISTVETNELGLVPNHAYALWGIVEISHKGNAVKLFRIHNPHGHGEWKGKWSDESGQWTKETLAQVGDIDLDDGTFYMELADVRTHFDEIVVCGVHPEWVEHRLPVVFPSTYQHQHSGFEFFVAEESSLVLSLTQPPQRVLRGDDVITDLAFVVLSIGDTETEIHAEGSRYFDSAPISLKGSTLLERDFPVGRYFLVPFSFWNKRGGGRVKDCTLVVQSSSAGVAITEHEVSLGQYRVALREFIVGACSATPALGHVKHSKTLPMTTYYRADGHGIVVWEENRHQSDPLRYDLHFDVFNGMWSSRGTQHISDAIPPLHGKLVAVALSVGITEDHDAQYTWKYTWGSFTKNRSYQLFLDDMSDIHCPIPGPYDFSVGLATQQQGPDFVKEEAVRKATQMVLPVLYTDIHPCIELEVGVEIDCHVAMLPGPHAAEEPELRKADEDTSAVDFSFVLLDATGKAVTSAPLNVMGSAVAGHTLQPGKYTVVPFNHSNKTLDGTIEDHPPVHIELVTFTTGAIQLTPSTLDVSHYTSALREYIVSRGGTKTIENEPVTKYTRHDGHGTLIWIDNLCHEKAVFHAMQFQTHDGIAMNRSDYDSGSIHFEDVVPPKSGKLVMVAWSSRATGESIRQANTMSHSNGWKTAKSFEKYCRTHNVQLETAPIFQPLSMVDT